METTHMSRQHRAQGQDSAHQIASQISTMVSNLILMPLLLLYKLSLVSDAALQPNLC